MIDIEKMKEEIFNDLDELDKDIDILRANMKKLREDLPGITYDMDFNSFDDEHDIERGLKHIRLIG